VITASGNLIEYEFFRFFVQNTQAVKKVAQLKCHDAHPFIGRVASDTDGRRSSGHLLTDGKEREKWPWFNQMRSTGESILFGFYYAAAQDLIQWATKRWLFFANVPAKSHRQTMWTAQVCFGG
jgi:hypothetical protein